MTEDDLDAIEARASAATPGPWTWITDRINARIVGRATRAGVRVARTTKGARDQWFGLLVGRARTPWARDWLEGKPEAAREPVDSFDFPHVLALRWADLKGDIFVGPIMPMPKDADFIAHARADVPALLAELRLWRGEALMLRAALHRAITDPSFAPSQTRKENPVMEHDPKVQFYKSGDQFATVTSALDPEDFLRECAAVLPGALVPHTGDEEFQLKGLLPQICDIWAKLRGYKADRVFEQRLLIAGTPNPSAHMALMSPPVPAINGHVAEDASVT